ncbi:uncharacterized protein LOC128231830 [Mya arenaria]|nr:uncharacterized protein LOC128231830 [Mya arenaria]XP_052801007.1 uncharacterized protein LOC128231830 [Mya arenaria]XP_052801008.1 uncharacterized protein LOC128231830 [Mya arenaria]
MGLAEEEVLIRDDSGLLLEDGDVRPQSRLHWCNKLSNTLILATAFFALGLCVAIPGPTLLDLGDQVTASTSVMMVVFVSRSIGYLLGALLGGALLDCFNRQLLLFCALLLASVATAVIPWSLTLLVMSVMFALQGVTMGTLDTGGNVFCIQLWGRQNGPYMQTLHFAFGIGAFIAPLLARPFLSPDPVGLTNYSAGVVQGNIPVSTDLHHQLPLLLNRTNRIKGLLDVENWQNRKSIHEGDTHSATKKSRYLRERGDYGFKLDGYIEQSYNNYVINDKVSIRLKRQGNANNQDKSQSGFWKWKGSGSKRFVRDEPAPNPNPTSTDTHTIISSNNAVNHLTLTEFINSSDKPANSNTTETNQQTSDTSVAGGNGSTTTPKILTSVSISQPIQKVMKPLASTDNGRKPETADGLSKNTVDDHLKNAENQAVPVEENEKPGSAHEGILIGKVNLTNLENGTISTDLDDEPFNSSSTINGTIVEKVTITTPVGSPTNVSRAYIQANTTPGPVASKPVPLLVPKTSSSTLKPTTVTATSTTAITSTTTQSTTTTKPTTSTTKSTTTKVSTHLTTATQSSTQKTTNSPKIEKPKVTKLTNRPSFTIKPSPPSVESNTKVTVSSTVPTPGNSTKPMTSVDTFIHRVKNLSRKSKIRIAYLIIGLLLVVSAILLLVMYCKRHRLSVNQDFDDYDRPKGVKFCYKAILMILFGIFFFLYIGLEVTFGALITTFTVDYNNWPKEQGVTVAAIFWGALATGRGFSIFLARCCRANVMLIIDLVFMTIGSLVLSFALEYHDKAIWLGTLILGLGMSSVFPAGISWAERFIHLSGKSTAVFVIGSAAGQMFIPSLTGYLYENLGFMVLMRGSLALTLSLIVLFIMISCLGRKMSHFVTVGNRNGFLPLSENDDRDNEEDLEMDLVHFSKSNARSRHVRMNGGGDAQYHVLISDLDDD